MEEDIKILKEVLNDFKTNIFGQKFIICYEKQLQAIENILNRLEQDERVIEEMAIELNNRDFGFDYGIEDEDLYDGIIDHFRKKCE